MTSVPVTDEDQLREAVFRLLLVWRARLPAADSSSALAVDVIVLRWLLHVATSHDNPHSSILEPRLLGRLLEVLDTHLIAPGSHSSMLKYLTACYQDSLDIVHDLIQLYSCIDNSFTNVCVENLQSSVSVTSEKLAGNLQLFDMEKTVGVVNRILKLVCKHTVPSYHATIDRGGRSALQESVAVRQAYML